MKNPFKLTTLCLALAITAAVPALRAEGEDAKPAAPEHGPRGPGRGPNLEMLSEQLGLSADQKAKIGPILKQERDQLKALRDDQSLSREQKMDKMRSIREENAKAVRAVLTPDQAKKLDEMRAQGPRGGRGGHMPRGEKPDAN